TVSLTVKVTTPLALEDPLAAEIVELPLPAVSETVLPLTGLLFASLSVAVMVEVVAPSAATEAGLALRVDVLALTVPAVKVTVAGGVTVMLSVVSSLLDALPISTVSLTVKVATPLALEVPLAAEIVELPLPAVSETVLPLTGLLFASLSVTVMVEVI